MESTQAPVHDERWLRACIRDLTALTNLPTTWIGRTPEALTESLRDMLRDMLHTEVVYVQLREPEGDRRHVATAGATPAETEGALAGTQPPEGAPRLLCRNGVPLAYLVSCPIGVRGDLGVMAVGRPSIELPNELETMLLQVVANHAAMALQQAILLLRRQGEAELESVRAAQQAAAARLGIRAFALPMDRLLHEAAAVVHDALRADCSDLLVLARSGRSLLLEAGVGWAQRLVGRTRVSARLASQAAFTLRSDEPLVVTNLGSEARFTVEPLYRRRGVVSSISAVVRDHRQPFGILSVHSLGLRSFTTDDVHFVQSVASLVAAAVQRLRAEAERDEMLVRLQRSLATRERLISVVAHDLGNPLSAILMASNVLLREDTPAHGGTERAAALVDRSARWMQRIVSDLLDRESLEAGRLALYPERVAPSAILDELQDLFTAAASERSVQFVVESEPDLPPIRADAVRLVQVLSNLVGNALKFTPAGGRIVLSARTSADTARSRRSGLAVRFAVSDTGPGIPREDLAHIFDWFWHGRLTRRGGTGLGLAIARSLVAAHRSRLDVESTGGRGTTFWFSLPAAHPEAAAPD